MLLRLWQNMQAFEDTLADYDAYRMYSTLVTDGLSFTMIPPDNLYSPNQPMLDINQVRILSMSHKYKPDGVYVGLLIYSVDGQTDFILNDVMLRIKTGDILIHKIPHSLTGQEEAYKDLIRALFRTHRVNLIGLVFTFSGNGQFNDYKRWVPTSANHLTPIHPTEQKLIEIVLIQLFMNHQWLSLPMASHIDVETLSQTAKKEYLLKLGGIEQLFHKRRKEIQRYNHLPIPKILRKDDFRSFEWTVHRQETLDSAVLTLMDQFYNLIHQVFQDGEFDRDQYIYYDDRTKQLFTNLANPYAQLQIKPTQNYYSTR